MNKFLIIIFGVILVIGAMAFYGGMKYGQSSRQNFQNLSEEQRQRFMQGNVSGSAQRQMRGQTGTNFVSGEVMAKDEQSLTLKTPDGGSKIVFFSDATQVSKMSEGSINDIEIGKQITITGTQNSDGSYTAKTIQLSPLLFGPAKN